MRKLTGIANVTNKNVHRPEMRTVPWRGDHVPQGSGTESGHAISQQKSSSSFLKTFILFIVYLATLSVVQITQLRMTGLVMHD